MKMTCWDLPEINRASWLINRFVCNSFAMLQPADRDDLSAEALFIAMNANRYRPETYYLNFQLIRKCVKTAGVHLGLLTVKSRADPAILSFSELDDSISYNMPEVERETYKENVVDINAWKARRATPR